MNLRSDPVKIQGSETFFTCLEVANIQIRMYLVYTVNYNWREAKCTNPTDRLYLPNVILYDTLQVL